MIDYYRIATWSMGVYPEKFGDQERTPWQDGWNAYGDELCDRAELFSSFVNDHPNKKQIEALLLNDDIDLHVKDGKVFATYNSGDIFAWGYADCEKITDEMWDDVYEACQTPYGIISYHCRRYNEKPQWPIEKDMREAGCWDLEDLPENRYDLQVRWGKKTRLEAIEDLNDYVEENNGND